MRMNLCYGLNQNFELSRVGTDQHWMTLYATHTAANNTTLTVNGKDEC